LPAKDNDKLQYHTCEESRAKYPALALARPLFSAERQEPLFVASLQEQGPKPGVKAHLLLQHQ